MLLVRAAWRHQCPSHTTPCHISAADAMACCSPSLSLALILLLAACPLGVVAVKNRVIAPPSFSFRFGRVEIAAPCPTRVFICPHPMPWYAIWRSDEGPNGSIKFRQLFFSTSSRADRRPPTTDHRPRLKQTPYGGGSVPAIGGGDGSPAADGGQSQRRPARFGKKYASAFQEASVAEAYAYRPPYPPAVFDILGSLLPAQPRRILDVGCGTGALARHLTRFGVPVDAVDISAPMIAHGQRLPNGAHPLIRWQNGAIEEISLTPGYDLITAGESLHWMDWHTVLPRFATLLAPSGRLAILDLGHERMPWSEQLERLIQRYSLSQEYQPVDLIAELERRKLFVVEDRIITPPWSFEQPIDAYVESFHGRASFARRRMTPQQIADFDRAVYSLVSPYCPETVALPIVATIVWGQPQSG